MTVKDMDIIYFAKKDMLKTPIVVTNRKELVSLVNHFQGANKTLRHLFLLYVLVLINFVQGVVSLG